MFKYIASEFVKAIKRKYTKLYMVGIFVLCLLANVAVLAFRLIYGAHEGTYAYNIMEYATWCFIIPYYSCIFIGDIVFGKEYPNPKIKNNYTKDLGAGRIYFSKLIASLLLGGVFAFMTVMFLIVITTIFQIRDGAITANALTDFAGKFMYAVPLWIAGMAIANMFLFMFTNKKLAYVGFFVTTLVIPRTIMLFAAEPFNIPVFRTVRKYLITQNFSLLPYPADPERSVERTIIIGIIFTILMSVIGVVIYMNKKVDYTQEKEKA